MTKEDRLKTICADMNKELNQGKTIEINFNYGETVVLTYKGKRICSRSGGGYDKLGAAFGDVVTYINPEALLSLYNAGTYKQCVYKYNNEIKVDGSMSFNMMLYIMRDMGYEIDYTRKISHRSENVLGKIIIKKG